MDKITQPLHQELMQLRAEAQSTLSQPGAPTSAGQAVKSAMRALYDALSETERLEAGVGKLAEDIRYAPDYRATQVSEPIAASEGKIASTFVDAEAKIAKAKDRIEQAILPPKPTASEALVLDRKQDLVRLLDRHQDPTQVFEAALNLAERAMKRGDQLTAHVLLSDHMGLFFEGRGVDQGQLRDAIISRVASPELAGLLVGPRSLDGALLIARTIADLEHPRVFDSLRRRARKAA